MGNNILRFITGAPPAEKEPDVIDLAHHHRNQAEMTGFQMELDQALTRSAIRSVVEVEHLRQQIAGDDPYLNSLIRPIQQAYSDRLARRLEGDL